MLLVIDNYDSFTYNLVQAFGEMGADIQVYRNDAITVDEIKELNPEKLIISPGPCSPTEAGISLDVIREFAGKVPIFGVCLGYQAICQAFGAKIVRASRLMHGKTSQITHDGKGIFTGLSCPFTATRYHSLMAKEDTLPSCLVATAHSVDKHELMAVRHREFAVEGVQFHPESFLTKEGGLLMRNFLEGVATV